MSYHTRPGDCVICGRRNEAPDGLKSNKVVRIDGSKKNLAVENMLSVCKTHYAQVMESLEKKQVPQAKPKPIKDVGIRIYKTATGAYKVIGVCGRPDIRAVEKAVLAWGQKERFERLV
jgi:hypothetical protein